jgi:hypothetical protein
MLMKRPIMPETLTISEIKKITSFLSQNNSNKTSEPLSDLHTEDHQKLHMIACFH